MCRRLINSIEELLKSLKVEKLVISAIPTLVETWTIGFGFQPLEEDEKRSLSKTNLMVFPGAVWLKKPLYENHTVQETSGELFSVEFEMGAYERGPTTEHAQLSDDFLRVQENNVEEGIHDGYLTNTQYCCEGNIMGIPQNHPPKLSLDEIHIHHLSNPSIKETNYNNSFVKEANLVSERSYDNTENMQSIEKQNSDVVFLNELSDCGFLQYPVSNVSPEELVYVPPGGQLEVVCGAEANGMHVEMQRQICVHVEKNALEPEDEK
ncbi:Increased DNA methylation 1 [Sesamum angolense]|uniref:Increased DNA methylation 1 n=1 Tax=Sesamum angolense TaxID=2727404 RepID=A0AAE1W5P6_9LAMI|nr:Increased DNA methylation 1 [Sesamum angolense]